MKILAWQLSYILTIFFFISCANFNRSAPKPSGSDWPEAQKYLENLIHREMVQNGLPSLSLILMTDKEVIWRKDFGYANVEHESSLQEDTVYRVGSISKPVTALRIMQLVEQGKIALDDPYIKYVPDFYMRSLGQWHKLITIRQLLSHHSGLAFSVYRGIMSRRPQSLAEFMIDLRSQYIAVKPGEVYLYSNLGFDLLGRLIEIIDNKSFGQSMKEHVLAPLGMNDSSFILTQSIYDRLAHAYKDGHPALDFKIRDAPAGGLYASSRDLVKLVNLFLNKGKLPNNKVFLKPETINEIWSPQFQDLALNLDYQTGFDWNLKDEDLSDLGALASHDGSMPFYYSRLMILRDQNLSFIALTNAATVNARESIRKISVETLRYAVSSLKKKEIIINEEKFQPRTLSKDEISNIEGYYSTEYGLIHIKDKKDHFQTQITDYAVELWPVQPEGFKVVYQLLGLFEIPVDFFSSWRLSFSEVAGKKLIIRHKNGLKLLFGEKVESAKISKKWEDRLGRYYVLNKDEDLVLLRSARLSVQSGILTLHAEFPHYLTEKVSFPLSPLSDYVARIPGLVRATGDYLWFEGDPSTGQETLNFSGYKLQKINP